MEKKKLEIHELEAELKRAGIAYEIIKHLPIKTVEEGLNFLGIEPADGVSTLIFRTDKGFFAVLRRDDHQLDFTKLKEVLGVDTLSLASDQEIIEQTGAAKGATPLLSGLRTVMDKSVLEREYVYGGTGSFEHDLKIKPNDLQRMTEADCQDVIKRRRVFSGSRPTGRLHLGNYLGGIKGYIALQERGDLDCIYSVVDLHGITSPYDPRAYQAKIKDVVLDYLGAGLDPKKCHLMIQSQVPEHVELAYLFGTIFPVSRVEQLPTYKEKKEQQPEYVNVGLFYYPILMAADILLYKAELIPVGKDQLPHIELTREVARKFNQMFPSPPAGGSGQVAFPEPEAYLTPGQVVPSLSGSGKMSKSVEGSFILLTDDLETIRERLAKMPTDSGKGEMVPVEGSVANLFSLVELFEGSDKRKEYEQAYLGEGVRYEDLKRELAEAILQELKPIQERRQFYEERPELVKQILDDGRTYCSQIARETMRQVKVTMGLVNNS